MRIVLLLLCGLLGAGAAERSHAELRQDANAAYDRKDYTAARKALTAALALRPDSPRDSYHLAALAALAGDSTTALAQLRHLAALGLFFAAGRDRDFASLQGTREFNEVLRMLQNNREPQGEADLFAELPGRTGIIEGIAFRARTGDLFLGDAHHRCIWRRDDMGKIARFTAEDEEVFGVFGLAVDEPRNALWAATTAVPAMAGFTKELKGQAALAEFDLTSGELRRILPLPDDGREHGLGDLVVGQDGTIYLSDSLAPIIWRLDPGSTTIAALIESPLFSSLQGLVISNRTLLVADYANGVFAIDVNARNVEENAERAIHRLIPPANATLSGIDGLVAAPGGVVGVQNGVEPQRLVHLALPSDFRSITKFTVLAAGLPDFSDLGLVTLAQGRLLVVANTGWETFDPEKQPQPAAHVVRVFQTRAP